MWYFLKESAGSRGISTPAVLLKLLNENNLVVN